MKRKKMNWVLQYTQPWQVDSFIPLRIVRIKIFIKNSLPKRLEIDYKINFTIIITITIIVTIIIIIMILTLSYLEIYLTNK